MFINEQSVQHALDHDAIVPYFHPIRELRTGRLIGFELLARLEHPDGLVLPNSFISVAEKSGLLTRLTEQMLTKAFAAATKFPEPLTLAVNISPQQFRDPNLAYHIEKIAQQYNFSLDRLVVEITETALIDNLNLAQTVTEKLKGLGCCLHIDDFGTGYSSLTHLQTLPFDGLKIDRSFVSNITHIRQDRKIVAALIGLGQNLGITTIAEGVETAEQASLLLYLGCHLVQGNLYGHPQPASHIRAFIDEPPHATAISSPQGQERNLFTIETLPAERVAQLQAIYDGAPVGLCYLSRDLRYISVNRWLAKIDGIAIVSMLGQKVESVQPEWFPLYLPHLRRALQGESMRDLELTRPSRKEGGPDQSLLYSVEPAKDETGEVIGISIAVLDITERKKEELRLTESEEKFRTIIDCNPQTPWIMDAAGNLTEVGNQWGKNTGLTREETLKRGYMESVIEEDRAEVWTIVQHCLNTGAPMDFECRARRPNGVVFWIRVRAKAVLNKDGKVLRYCGSTDDIDELATLRELAK